MFFLIAGLYFGFIHGAVATESAIEHLARVGIADRGAVVGLEDLESARKIPAQQGHRMEDEVHCLALNIYFEARSEPEKGQRAVGHVVMNRVAHQGYPDSVCEVVRQGGEQELHRCQFSWWCDGQPDTPVDQIAWNQSLRLAREIYFGNLKDTTDGALWYHAIYVKPYWSSILRQGDKIGQHIFYLENRETGKTM